MTHIYLSPPDMGPDERALLLDAFDSNWIAPVGAHLDAFEREVAAMAGVRYGVAVSSGTAGLHLALLLAGVEPGDDVLVPTLTFVATANAVAYVGATPSFLDSEPTSWNLDPDLLAEELAERSTDGRLPAAVIAVDLYGQCADYSRIEPICAQYGVPLIEDAAEALGATHGDRPAGSFGLFGVYSFNGNKVITTSSGGMLLTENSELADRARFLATQARDDAPHYEHSETGFNYRMSNLLAAVGRGQLAHLSEKVARRRAINSRYREAFADLEGIRFMPNAPEGNPINWLTVVTIDPVAFGAGREAVGVFLEARDIEARPAWKPCHLQPLFEGAAVRGGAVAEQIFHEGLCLPSGSGLTELELERVVEAVRSSRP